jgi:hypothetical protein
VAATLWGSVTINHHYDSDEAIRLVLNDHPHDLDRARQEAVFAVFEPIKTLVGLLSEIFLDF